MNVIYLARKPVYASWCLEYPEGSAVTFFQINDEILRVIGSLHWKQGVSLTTCMDEITATFPWMPRLHLISESKEWMQIFEEQDLLAQSVPMPPVDVYTAITRQYLSQMMIDTQSRPWTHSEENNLPLTDALSNYKFLDPQGMKLSSTIAHTQELFFARSIERMCVWAFSDSMTQAWGSAPSYKEHDKAVI